MKNKKCIQNIWYFFNWLWLHHMNIFISFTNFMLPNTTPHLHKRVPLIMGGAGWKSPLYLQKRIHHRIFQALLWMLFLVAVYK